MNRTSSMSRVHGRTLRWLACLTLVAAVGGGAYATPSVARAVPNRVQPAAAGGGSRLATPAEAKALHSAFFRNGQHHKGALISSMQVDRADRSWARIRYFAKPPRIPGPAGVAPHAAPKMIYVNYRQSGSSHHPSEHPTKAKPPSKVEKDLDKDLWLKVIYQGDWTENAKFAWTHAQNCSGGLVSTENLSWSADDHGDFHVTRLLDVSKAQFSYALLGDRLADATDYKSPVSTPTYGDGSEKLAYDDHYSEPTCVSQGPDFTATAHGTVHGPLLNNNLTTPIEVVTGVGLILWVPPALGRRRTSDGQLHNNELGAIGGPRLVGEFGAQRFAVPFLDGTNYDFGAEQPFSFSFARNSLGKREATIHSSPAGYCYTKGHPGAQCSDTLKYHGTVTVEVGTAPTK